MVAGNTVTQLAMTQKHSNLQNVLAKVQKKHKEKLAVALEQSGKINASTTGQFTVGQWAETWFENYVKPSIWETILISASSQASEKLSLISSQCLTSRSFSTRH